MCQRKTQAIENGPANVPKVENIFFIFKLSYLVGCLAILRVGSPAARRLEKFLTIHLPQSHLTPEDGGFMLQVQHLRGQTMAVATAKDKSPRPYLKKIAEVFIVSGHQESG